MMTQYNKILANGLRVALLPLPALHGTHLVYAVRCGSRHEGPAQWGLSHFLEHMMFRGSRQHRSIASLMQVFEQAGGTLDAGTWRDHTHFELGIHPSGLREVLQALGSMLAAPRFADLAVERAIVVEEIKASLDDAGSDADLTNLSRGCLWRGHPLGRRITGSLASVGRFGRADLLAHHRRFYGARNAVLCIAGQFDPAAALRWVRQSFAELPAGAPAADGAKVVCDAACSSCLRDYEAGQISLQLAYPALPDGHEDFLAARLLANVLDDGLTTRLPQALCDRRGLVYDLASGLDCYADVGVYDVEMHLDPLQAKTALHVVKATLEELCAAGIRPTEWHRAQARWLHQLDVRQDDAAAMAQQAAQKVLFHGAQKRLSRPLLEEAQAIKKLTVADALRVARQLFAEARPHLAALGPLRRAGLRRCGDMAA